MSGISAQYADGLEFRIKELGEQVEKLTEERDEASQKWLSEQARNLAEEAEFEEMGQRIVDLERQSFVDTAAIENLCDQLAALAEQNAKMRSFFEFAWKDIPMSEYAFEILEHVMNLPNLATPVLNKIRAEAYREAAEIVGPEDSYKDQWFKAKADSCAKLRAKADELEKTNGAT